MNVKSILIAVLTGVLGFAAGYFVFKDHSEKAAAESLSEATEYTCSMHPQIRQNEPGICPICEMDLIPVGSNTSNDPTVLEMTEEAVKLAQIQTITVGGTKPSTGESNTIRLTGKIQPDERRAAALSAHIPGRIEKLFVSFTGEQVRKGQRIASIYSPDLITAQQELLEALKLRDLNPNLAEAARNKLRFWKIGERTIAEIEQSGKVRETFDLFGEASGVVSNRRVSVGDYLRKGEPLFDLMNLGKVWVLFDAFERDLANIRVGDRIEFTSPAVPNRVFKTKITFIDPLLNPSTRAASIRAEVNNSGGLLKPEMFVTGMLQNKVSKTQKSQLTIPKSAVLWTGKRSVVYIRLSDTEIPTFQFKEIQIGQSVGDNYVVEAGLSGGEVIVTYGNFALDAAAQLNNQTSMMNRNVKVKKEAAGLPDFQEKTPADFKKQLYVLAEAYLHLKDAFVQTDAGSAATAATDFLKKSEEVNMSLLKGEAHIFWMQQLEAMQSHGDKISELSDVEVQRKQFGFLSEALINSLKVFGTEGALLYVQHCPMAFDNKGADWLSAEEQIRNPYFGDKMMKCGAVKWTFE